MEKKVKICCVVSTDITLKFMLLNQLRFLRGQGYEVFATSAPGKWVQDIQKEGINVTTIGFKRKFSFFSDMVSFLRLYFYFKKEKFDVVHVHSLKPEFYGQIAAKLAGVPIILNTLHGFDFAEDDPVFKKNLYLWLERTAAKCSTLIFSIGYHIIERAKKENIGAPEKLVYLGRDIDIERFDPEKFPANIVAEKKKSLGISTEQKVVGIVARLVAEKGYLDLFEAFKKVISKFPDVLLMVIGQEESEKKDGFTKEIVKNYHIENNVIFLGERTDTEELYSTMDVFVLPTHREGLGAAILEAEAMQKPVIATNVGGCPETIDDKKTGMLVVPKNPEELAKAILYLLKNPEIAKNMGIEGRKKILNEFSSKIVFKRLGGEYEKLINEKL